MFVSIYRFIAPRCIALYIAAAMNPLVYVVPVFLVLMLIEYLVARAQNMQVYSFRETVSNLYCAIGQVFIETFFKVPLIGLYYWVQKYSPELAPQGAWKWLVLFVMVDFLFWLSHLIAHKVPWMWAIHGVHHQSEHYNFSVGLRMPWWHKFTAFWIVIPPALMGFTLTDYIIVASLHGSAQIWTHTTLLKKRIPVFEWIFVTPSHHRVHHGKNKRYIDKNFGGILSVWDYIFKTYEPETEPVRFGIPKIKARVNPWSSNIVQFIPELMPSLPKMTRLTKQAKIFVTTFTLTLITGVMLVFAMEGKLTVEARLMALCVSLGSMIVVGTWMDHRDDWFRTLNLRFNPRLTTLLLLVGLSFI